MGTRPHPVDDTELLARAGRGDEAAVHELDLRHRSLAVGVGFRVLRDRTLAEDAAQDAFVDLWRTAASFDPGRSSVRAWICVLTHRRAVDIARREARRRLEDEQPHELLHPESYTAEELVVERETRSAVRRALRGLPEPQRELVALAYWGGLSQSQLAERLNLPLGTVKSRTFEALRALGVELAAA